MATENTTRVSLRLKKDVRQAVLQQSTEQGIDSTNFTVSIMDQLSDERQEQIKNTNQLIAYAQKVAKELFGQDKFDEHFILTVVRHLIADSEGRNLYEKVIAVDAYKDAAPGKTPVNMYLGWYIKNAVPATPLLDSNGKPTRTFVKGEPIKSYTRLTRA